MARPSASIRRALSEPSGDSRSHVVCGRWDTTYNLLLARPICHLRPITYLFSGQLDIEGVDFLSSDVAEDQGGTIRRQPCPRTRPCP
jgi:hypothetical protein